MKTFMTICAVVTMMAGSAMALPINETFDTAPVLTVNAVDGDWYVDRYAPAGFTSVNFDGDNRLKLSIDASDGVDGRPSSFSSSFYNTQGRAFATPGATKISIDMYVPADWATSGRRMGALWAVDNDGSGLTNRYPIVEFSGAGSTVGFNAWGADDAWHELGLPTGFVYNSWNTLTLELTASQVILSVGDLTYTDSNNGATELGAVILQGYNSYTDNAGVTYDVYFDNLSAVPEPTTFALGGLSLALLVVSRRRRKLA